MAKTARLFPRLAASLPNFALKYDSFLLEAAHADSIRVDRSQTFPFLVRPLLCLPALSLFPGQTPAQEAS